MIPSRGWIRIDSVSVPESGGRIGLCACPGVHAYFGGKARDLDEDLWAIREWGAEGIVTLLEAEEVEILGIGHMPESAGRLGMWWRHLPIRDMCAPDDAFHAEWAVEGERLRRILKGGGRFVVHCWAGLGRTGTVAARLLVESGLTPEAAIGEVRDARPGSIQSLAQEVYVQRLGARE